MRRWSLDADGPVHHLIAVFTRNCNKKKGSKGRLAPCSNYVDPYAHAITWTMSLDQNIERRHCQTKEMKRIQATSPCLICLSWPNIERHCRSGEGNEKDTRNVAIWAWCLHGYSPVRDCDSAQPGKKILCGRPENHPGNFTTTAVEALTYWLIASQAHLHKYISPL